MGGGVVLENPLLYLKFINLHFPSTLFLSIAIEDMLHRRWKGNAGFSRCGNYQCHFILRIFQLQMVLVKLVLLILQLRE